MTKVLQMIFLADSKDYLFLKEIKFETGNSGRIRFNGQPTLLKREEHFDIQKKMVHTENFHFPVPYLLKWLDANDCINATTGAVTDLWTEPD